MCEREKGIRGTNQSSRGRNKAICKSASGGANPAAEFDIVRVRGVARSVPLRCATYP